MRWISKKKQAFKTVQSIPRNNKANDNKVMFTKKDKKEHFLFYFMTRCQYYHHHHHHHHRRILIMVYQKVPSSTTTNPAMVTQEWLPYSAGLVVMTTLFTLSLMGRNKIFGKSHLLSQKDNAADMAKE